MSVVIQPEDSNGQADELKALLADLHAVAGGEPVTVVSYGVRVSRKVALAFLRSKDTSDANTSGHTVDNTRDPLVTIHADASTGREQHREDTSARPEGLAIGGLTPDGEFPGGYEGVRADRRDGQPGDALAAAQAEGTSPESTGGDSGEDSAPVQPSRKATDAPPAKKATPAKKTTAAAQQRASRSTPRSNQ